MYQILIQNGTVIDPANQLNAVADVAVADGKIVGVGQFGEEAAQMVIEAKGCIVTPGLVDHHTHLYPLARIGIPAEAVCFASGVTTAVDAGSTGCDTYRQHRPFLESSKLTIKAYINVCSNGLDSLPHKMEEVAPEKIDAGAIREIFQEYGADLCGLKLRSSKEIVGEMGYKPLQRMVELASEIGVPVMVHCTNLPGKMAELLQCLRKGDIITHMYMNKGDTILDESGKINAAARNARERGVLFEAADARAHFSFEVSEAAMKEEFYPDIIATDLTKLSMNLRPTAFNLANQIGKYTWLGVPFEKVIERCTSIPARLMGLEGQIGCLSAGANADITIFRKFFRKTEFGDRPYTDPECQFRYGETGIEPLLTVKNGEVVFRSMMI